MKVDAYFPHRRLISLVIQFCILALGPAMGGLMDCQAQEGRWEEPRGGQDWRLDTPGETRTPLLLHACVVDTGRGGRVSIGYWSSSDSHDQASAREFL